MHYGYFSGHIYMWRKPLNSAVLVTVTHKKPNGVSDRTATQVRAQMINKYMIKPTPYLILRN